MHPSLLLVYRSCYQYHARLLNLLEACRLQPSLLPVSLAVKASSLSRLVLAYTSKVVLVGLLYILFKYRSTALGVTPRPDLPGPRGLPLLGNTLYMLRRPKGQHYQVQTRFHEQFGKVYTVSVIGFPRVINIRDPQMLEHVLKNHFWKYEKGDLFRTVLHPLIGGGIFGADGQHWKWQRKHVCRIFNVRALREYTSNVFARQSQLVIDYFNKITHDTRRPSGYEEATVDLQSIFLLFTLDTFGEIAFGRSFGCLKTPERQVDFAAAFDRMNVDLSSRFCTPFWRWVEWWTGKDRRIESDNKVICDFAYNLIEQRRRECERAAADEPKKGDEDENRPKDPDTKRFRKDLMQLFMEAENDLGEPLSDEALKDMLLNFILAGRDTTAQALSWMFYLILCSERRERIVGRIVSESDDLFQSVDGARETPPTYERVKAQRYTEACFFEALRLYPSVPHNIRVCVEDDVLPGCTRVHKGEMIAWGSWAMGRDAAIWGPDAKEFRPERWLQGEKFSPSKFVAFNMGPRSCLGKQFATIEVITLTLTLFQQFSFKLVNPDKEPAYQRALTLPMTDGLQVRIRRRNAESVEG